MSTPVLFIRVPHADALWSIASISEIARNGSLYWYADLEDFLNKMEGNLKYNSGMVSCR